LDNTSPVVYLNNPLAYLNKGGSEGVDAKLLLKLFEIWGTLQINLFVSTVKSPPPNVLPTGLRPGGGSPW
jgi:hypothetical protein